MPWVVYVPLEQLDCAVTCILIFHGAFGSTYDDRAFLPPAPGGGVSAASHPLHRRVQHNDLHADVTRTNDALQLREIHDCSQLW